MGWSAGRSGFVSWSEWVGQLVDVGWSAGQSGLVSWLEWVGQLVGVGWSAGRSGLVSWPVWLVRKSVLYSYTQCRNVYLGTAEMLNVISGQGHHTISRLGGGQNRKRPAVNDVPWKEETGPLSIRPTLELFVKGKLGNF